MNLQEEFIKEIGAYCSEVEPLPIAGFHFVYHGHHMVYLPAQGSQRVRFCIPFIAKAQEFKPERLATYINETNREVRYIKVIELENGCISLNYDHKMSSGEKAKDIVPHILETLDFASHYFLRKINDKEGLLPSALNH